MARHAFPVRLVEGNVDTLCGTGDLIWPAVPIRPKETTSSVPSTVTCQYFLEVPPMNSK